MKHKVSIYKDKKKEWRWSITAANGRKVAEGGEGYKRRNTMLRSMFRLFSSSTEIIMAIHLMSYGAKTNETFFESMDGVSDE